MYTATMEQIRYAKKYMARNYDTVVELANRANNPLGLYTNADLESLYDQ